MAERALSAEDAASLEIRLDGPASGTERNGSNDRPASGRRDGPASGWRDGPASATLEPFDETLKPVERRTGGVPAGMSFVRPAVRGRGRVRGGLVAALPALTSVRDHFPGGESRGSCGESEGETERD